MAWAFEEKGSGEESRAALGAHYSGDGRCRFQVWAPLARGVALHLQPPGELLVPMGAKERGYYEVTVEGIEPGRLYVYRLDETREFPDPASRYQPQGVHGPSQVVDPRYCWDERGWAGLPLRDYITYELHVGTFTREGTFDAVIPHVEELRELGITAIELMPVAQFPGERNWGYDGAYPFAVQNSYGGPHGLKRLVNTCHQQEIAVILDVVYNHLGPEGNYLGNFGHYFTGRYQTPWGPALNFDGPHSDEVRRFFIENALRWINEFHIDALRLDAVHAILDRSPIPFLQELPVPVSAEVKNLRRDAFLIAESADNDARVIRPRDLGGYGLDAQWNDDFHHSLRTLLTGDRSGYYRDYGKLGHLAKAFREGFIYTGEYSAFRLRRHGSPSRDIPAERFVVFAQNHDQVGNRMRGDRLSESVSFEGLKLAAGMVILSPFLPLIFMGEEYGETARFPYFVSHSDPDLAEAVRRGRMEEFAGFQWKGEIPDPQDRETFEQAKLNHSLKEKDLHRILLSFYRELMRLRKELPALACLSKEAMDVADYEEDRVLLVHRWADKDEVFMVSNFGEKDTVILLPIPEGRWQKLLDSAGVEWRGRGSLVPDRMISHGNLELRLPPMAFALFGGDS